MVYFPVFNATHFLRRFFAHALVCVCVASAGGAAAQFSLDDSWPISVTAAVVQEPSVSDPLIVELRMTVPADYYVYSSPDKFFSFSVERIAGLKTPVIALPETRHIVDIFAMEEGVEVSVFAENPVFKLTAPIEGDESNRWALTVQLTYQACSDVLCLSPKTETVNLSGEFDGTHSVQLSNADRDQTGGGHSPQTSRAMLDGFSETARGFGMMRVDPFLDLLKAGRAGEKAGQGIWNHLGDQHILVAVLIILLGGMALNLTPCVLPMIPVNLAIIGAGSQAGSRTRGFLLGATYGGAIAIVYGLLGLVVTFTSANFGSLNASPWFNIVMAAVFLILGLAMIGVFNIDLSRFGNGVGTGNMSRGSFSLAAFMGGVAALLAGACVAPIVIAVLVLAGQQVARGNILALAYPFLLGLGMGLPWAFAGAGLSFLPKPGKWMAYVKYAFGAFVLLMAVYYGALGMRLLNPAEVAEETGEGPAGWHTQLAPALKEARLTGKPVFIDFWATWCKNCKAMDRTTFKDERVVDELEKFVRVKFQAEVPGSPDVKPIWDYFELKGLPSYIILRPAIEKSQ